MRHTVPLRDILLFLFLTFGTKKHRLHELTVVMLFANSSAQPTLVNCDIESVAVVLSDAVYSVLLRPEDIQTAHLLSV